MGFARVSVPLPAKRSPTGRGAVGTKQPVIARLEDADYEGHSLTMLQRIATALDQKLEIHLVPVADKVQHA
jgi:hypothetical protein